MMSRSRRGGELYISLAIFFGGSVKNFKDSIGKVVLERKLQIR